MGKPNNIKQAKSDSNPQQAPQEIAPTLSKLKENTDLWFTIKVLIYDLMNLSRNPASEARTLRTTDELYISAPYFTPEEAKLIKNTLVENPEVHDEEASETTETTPNVATDIGEVTQLTGPIALDQKTTLGDAIKSRLANFFEKRRASRDARPCGPYDMAPVYLKVFGIRAEELRDERFLGRLRRSGLACNKSAGNSRDTVTKKRRAKDINKARETAKLTH